MYFIINISSFFWNFTCIQRLLFFLWRNNFFSQISNSTFCDFLSHFSFHSLIYFFVESLRLLQLKTYDWWPLFKLKPWDAKKHEFQRQRARFLHLILLICKEFTNEFSKHLFVVLLTTPVKSCLEDTCVKFPRSKHFIEWNEIFFSPNVRTRVVIMYVYI